MNRIFPIFLLVWTLFFSNAAPAKGLENVVERPLSDWLKNNPYGANWLAGKYVICMGMNPFLDFNEMPYGDGAFPGSDGEQAGLWDSLLTMKEGETVTTGTIFEKTMPDGTAEITIDINVENGPMTIYRFEEFRAYIMARSADPDNVDLLNNPPEPVLGDRENGSINYKAFIKITNPAPGMDIGFIYQYTTNQFPGWDAKAWAFNGTGSGTFTDHAADFTDWPFAIGTDGTVHLPGTLAVGKPAHAQGEGFDLGVFDMERGKGN